ncbi:WhiB family transcriptional regulator [Streptomyces sp. ms191]|uniref:WhiB family transcriptional regulator n=1 Tax=Streptomyces sp. ms191 TaxID=1827978 RepID=UPI0011CDECB5|nr:WhiB family transcriptional regulator [Streptomyces sp. ms191]TXS13390.1 WhiB family transcriptional regulator [Streptomyces sp. ms191]
MSTRGTSLPHVPNWRAFAACLGEDPDTMFPATGDLAGIEAAKKVCYRCPVVNRCLNDILEFEAGRGKESRHGVAGGLSSSQRYALYSSRRKAVA